MSVSDGGVTGGGGEFVVTSAEGGDSFGIRSFDDDGADSVTSFGGSSTDVDIAGAFGDILTGEVGVVVFSFRGFVVGMANVVNDSLCNFFGGMVSVVISASFRSLFVCLANVVSDSFVDFFGSKADVVASFCRSVSSSSIGSVGMLSIQSNIR